MKWFDSMSTSRLTSLLKFVCMLFSVSAVFLTTRLNIYAMPASSPHSKVCQRTERERVLEVEDG